ncbi:MULTISPECIES: aminotransferase class I/II-fold pyridoxal phosphate-dependent enzyme [Streptomyces]|uniref:aminotransferase class I/II-fold pyridoxal phosphate-dependent enzyme n=1 Tax=Streptomyces TaxID=1883 RepID=UPI001E45DF33|nr:MULTISPECIES: aminotransferase class I/II-fold pyridoxal phosphate-dependent enzyme [Streptomyces]UFQ18605.1 aminotransferase class I/II-fold pyridoxal phosphate-dependent enzyme [Streptomyces huasconensis]WCL88220.1 aminotransferase class I/II-fold pyridoxal phosphate-dependent enzyme [Streptomyces sp. JCM 35825]
MTRTPVSPPDAFAGAAERQGGDLRHLPSGRDLLDLGTCVNRYGPPPAVEKVLADVDARALRTHPYDASEQFTAAYASYLHVAPEDLLVGRGITEFLTVLAQVCAPEDSVVITPDYTDTIRLFPRHLGPGGGSGAGSGTGRNDVVRDSVRGRTERVAAAMRERRFVVLSNPNNPLGLYIPRSDLVRICRANPGATLIVDEAYADFMADATLSMTRCGLDNVVVLQSPNKLFGIAGVRTGALWTRNDALREAVRRRLPNWPLSYLDAAVATAALGERSWAAETRTRLLDAGRRMEGLLCERFGDAVVTGAPVHFRFVHTDDAQRAHEVYERLAEAGVVVRIFSGTSPGRAPGLRIVAPTDHEMSRVADALSRLPEHLPERPAGGPARTRPIPAPYAAAPVPSETSRVR